MISNGPIAPAVQASSAIPGVFLPVHLYGHVLVDGGVSDSIPVNLVKPYRPSVIIAVDISPQLSQKMPATATGILERSLLILREKASAQNLQEANITIRPHVGQAGAFDVKDKHQLYDAGVQAAQQQLPAILKLLKEEKNITLSSAQHVGWAVKLTTY